MPDKFDLPPNLDAHFPAHGWIESVGGIKLLLAPVTQLIRTPFEIEQHRRNAGLPNVKLDRHWIKLSTTSNTLRRLAICLRELHREVREVGPLFDSTEKSELTRHHEGCENIEFLLVAAFTLLRRFADDLVLALRPALFACHQSAPDKLAKLVGWRDQGRLDEAKPICNLEVLDQALGDHTSWLFKLRGTKREGIRDILIHSPHQLAVMATKAGKGPWKVKVQLTDERERHHDLLPILVECVDGLCSLMTLLCWAIGVLKGYTEWDHIVLSGLDNDTVGFWPPICGERPSLPMSSDGRSVYWERKSSS